MSKTNLFKTSFALTLIVMITIGGAIASTAQAGFGLAKPSCPTRECPNVCGSINQACTLIVDGAPRLCQVAIHLLADPQPGETDFCYHSCN